MARSTRLVILIKNIYIWGRKRFLLPVTYCPTNLVYSFTLRVTGIIILQSAYKSIPHTKPPRSHHNVHIEQVQCSNASSYVIVEQRSSTRSKSFLSACSLSFWHISRPVTAFRLCSGMVVMQHLFNFLWQGHLHRARGQVGKSFANVLGRPKIRGRGLVAPRLITKLPIPIIRNWKI